jgi:hypothetical protein
MTELCEVVITAPDPDYLAWIAKETDTASGHADGPAKDWTG